MGGYSGVSGARATRSRQRGHQAAPGHAWQSMHGRRTTGPDPPRPRTAGQAATGVPDRAAARMPPRGLCQRRHAGREPQTAHRHVPRGQEVTFVDEGQQVTAGHQRCSAVKLCTVTVLRLSGPSAAGWASAGEDCGDGVGTTQRLFRTSRWVSCSEVTVLLAHARHTHWAVYGSLLGTSDSSLRAMTRMSRSRRTPRGSARTGGEGPEVDARPVQRGHRGDRAR